VNALRAVIDNVDPMRGIAYDYTTRATDPEDIGQERLDSGGIRSS